MRSLYRTIVRPLLTEKTSAMRMERGEYVFEVAPGATKPAIRQAIEKLFGVKVTGVWTMNARGKLRRVGKSAGRRPDWKKAFVTLREGDTIEGIFEG
jgi:large subunit ribosomal protein L23